MAQGRLYNHSKVVAVVRVDSFRHADYLTMNDKNPDALLDKASVFCNELIIHILTSRGFPKGKAPTHR